MYYVFIKQVSAEQLSYNDFKKEEIDKIKKRMSVEFIKEYIKYINARNKYNDKPHTKEELKQKVMDYAKHANIDPKDSKAITNHLKTNNNIGPDKWLDDGNEKNIYKIDIPTKSKKLNKKIIFAKKRFSNSEQVYSNESIAISAVLSLMERQPKYYTNQTMEVVKPHNGGLFNIGLIGDAKYNARKLMFPLFDEAYFNSYFVTNEQNENIRMSRIDIDNDAATVPQNIFERLGKQYIALNEQVGANDNTDIEQLCKEILKNLSITPELIELSVTQHLKSIGCNDKDIKENIKLAIQTFTYHLQCLQVMRSLFRTGQIPQNDINTIKIDKAEQQQKEWISQRHQFQDYKSIKQFMSYWIWRYNSNYVVPGYPDWFTKLKQMFTDKTNDINDELMKQLNQQFNEKLDKTIEKFTNYISLQDKIENIENKVNKTIKQNPVLSKYKKSITTYLQKEIDNGKNIKDIKINDLVKQFAENTNNPTLYWKVVMKEKQQREKKLNHKKCFGERGWNKLSNIKPTKAINTNFGIGIK